MAYVTETGLALGKWIRRQTDGAEKLSSAKKEKLTALGLSLAKPEVQERQNDRFLQQQREKYMKKAIRTLIVGAGDAGKTVVRELQNCQFINNLPICMVDDDDSKIGTNFHGVSVVGKTTDIVEIVNTNDIQEIFICMPSVSKEAVNRIYAICKQTDCTIKILPGIYQLIKGEYLFPKIRDLEITDLLGRKPIDVLNDEIKKFYEDKVVLITGGGGSIGSELCRQIARMHPKQVIILDIYENCAYDIQQELKMKYGTAFDLRIEIVSICNKPALERVFRKYRPNIVVMAAAHKHVPLMENNVIEAVENNVFGTLNTVELSEKYNVDRVHMVSTDKAVNPTNVMGATKRICEMIIQSHSTKKQHTKFSATRFGNVLGSAGSVIPLFKKQISNGGPVTLTDYRIIRYFMTIPEASQLILASASMAKNGELFVLDMGQPVRIYDLAVNMIKMCGLEPGKDIEIIETGLRPGEKLFEELLVETEKLDKTKNSLIFIEKDKPISLDELDAKIRKLSNSVAVGDDEGMRTTLKEVVSTFIDSETANSLLRNKFNVQTKRKIPG